VVAGLASREMIYNMARLIKSPEDCYLSDVKSGVVVHDAFQLVAVRRLQSIFEDVCRPPDRTSLNILSKLSLIKNPTWKPVAGLYLWGSVGRGKTYVVDSFYQCLPFSHKARLHFHHFMDQTHEKLHSVKNETDPLAIVATQWAHKMRVLCLDEFHVSDIADAMILANLFEGLFKSGVTIITTSNQAPDMLYSGGLQRARFLPAIALIKKNTQVLELKGSEDHRLRALERAPVYYCCSNGERYGELERSFQSLAPGASLVTAEVLVRGRSIPAIRKSDGVVWFDFKALCEGNRSVSDYIELARIYHTIILSDVPVLGIDDNDAAKRFVDFVDEIYDRNVNLVVSAEGEPIELYTGSRLSGQFLRTASRLEEMRTHEYLAASHKPQ